MLISFVALVPQSDDTATNYKIIRKYVIKTIKANIHQKYVSLPIKFLIICSLYLNPVSFVRFKTKIAVVETH